MAAEAFDPFASDGDDEFLHEMHPPPPHPHAPHPTQQRSTSPGDTSSSDAPRVSPRSSPRSSPWRNITNVSKSNINNLPSNISTDDILKEFDTAFPSMTLGDDPATDQFGFPSTFFPATFEHIDDGANHADTNVTPIATFQNRPVSNIDLEGVTFVIAESMSVIHKSQTSQCLVRVGGNVSLDETPPHAKPGQPLSCDISFLDPKSHIDAVASKNDDYVRSIALASEFDTMNALHDNCILRDTTSFRLSLPELNGAMDNWYVGGPLMEYTCGDKLRPVPMLINTDIQELNDQCCQIMFQLRVNPRNVNSLLNTVVIVCVPREFDGEMAQVSSVGRSIGKGRIDTHWSGITRILSWRLGELYSGAICEFEALFTPSDYDNEHAQAVIDHGPSGPTETNFPVLLRYDSEGSLLSDVDLDFGQEASDNHAPTIKRRFRVYHREV